MATTPRREFHSQLNFNSIFRRSPQFTNDDDALRISREISRGIKISGNRRGAFMRFYAKLKPAVRRLGCNFRALFEERGDFSRDQGRVIAAYYVGGNC